MPHSQRCFPKVLSFIAGCSLIAAAAQAQPTLSKSFSPSTMGPGSVSTTTFTITNGSGSPVTDLAFTDVLPAAVTIAVPAQASTTCSLGTGASLDAPEGGSTITFSGFRAAAFTSCTVSVDVTSTTPGTHTNPAIILSSSAGSSMSVATDLTVATNRPGFTKSFSPSTISFGGRSTLTFTVDNSLNGGNTSFLTFTDTFPSGMVVASPANATTDCDFSSTPVFTAVPGSGSVSLSPGASSGSVAASATCTLSVDVTAGSAGEFGNTSGDLSTNSGPAGKASAILTVTGFSDLLSLEKEFTDDPVPPGGTVTLEFTVTNRSRSDSATNITFSDDLDAVVSGLAPTLPPSPDPPCGVGSSLGFSLGVLTFTGGNLAAESSCTFSVSLAVPGGTTPDSYSNETGQVSGEVGGSPEVGNTASDLLFVVSYPVLTIEFTDDPVGTGDTVTLEYTITNPEATSAMSGITFIDELTDATNDDGTPSGGFLPFPVSATLPPVPNPPCGGASSLSLIGLGTERQGLFLTGGSLAASGSCTFSVTLTIPDGLAPTTYTSTTRDISGVLDDFPGPPTVTGPAASDDIVVVAAPQLSKEFTDDPALPGGTVTLEFVLENPNLSEAASGIAFSDDLAAVLTGLTAFSVDTNTCSGTVVDISTNNTFIDVSGGTLAADSSCTISLTLTLPAGPLPAASFSNTTSVVTATVAGLATTSPAANDSLVATALVSSKEFTDDPVIAGDTVTLTFTYDNTAGTENVTDITMQDPYDSDVLPGLVATLPPVPDPPCGLGSALTIVNPAGPSVAGLRLVGGNVLAGASCSFSVTFVVPAGTADGEYANVTSTNSALIGGVATVLTPLADTLTVDSTLLGLTKEFTDDPVTPGGTVNLEFVVTNLSATETVTDIAFDDDLDAALSGLLATGFTTNTCGGGAAGFPAGLFEYSGGSLLPGASCTVAISVDVPAGPLAGNVFANTTTTATGLVGGLAVFGPAASDDLHVETLALSKSFDAPATATGTAVLTFTIENLDSSSGVSDLAFSDNLGSVISGLQATILPSTPCGAGSALTGTSFLTFSGGSLGPSGTCSFDVTVSVPSSATPGDFLNTTGNLFENGLSVASPATAFLTIEPPPDFDKSFLPSAAGLGVPVTLRFTIDNTASSLAADSVDFTDNLPAGLVVATPANGSTTCTGGTLTAMAGGGTVTYSGGSVAATSTCTVQVDVVSTATGFLSNTTGDLTSSSGNSGTADAILAVDPQPGFAKSFSPNAIAIGGTSTLTFTIDNSLATVAAIGLDFTDNLPAGVVLATPSGASTDCTGGTLTATAGTGFITYTGGTVAASSLCTIDVDVTSSVAGTHQNISGTLTSSLGSSGTASADLRVNPPPDFSKAFAPNPSIIGGVVTLTFTIDNTASTVSASSLDFTDNLPAALLVATPANVTNGCGGAVTATAGTASIQLTGGSVAAAAVCTLSVDVISSAAGDHDNTTGELTSSLGSSGTAVASLRVDPPPGFGKAFVPATIGVGDTGTLVFSIHNSGSSASATGLAFSDTLPAGVTVADPTNSTTDCSGGLVTALAGSGTVAYAGGSVAAATSCTVSVDITSSTLGMHLNTSGALTSSLGNSGTAEATLTVVDLESPEVTSVTTSAGELADCDDVRTPIGTIGVTITDSRTPIVGADNLSAYVLVEAGPDGDFTTADCSGVAGDDVAVTVQSVSVDDTDPLSVHAGVQVAGSSGLAAGLYRFIVCGSITDSAGNEVLSFQVPFFRADPLNLLVNGHFDDCPATLDPWITVAVPLNAVQPGSAGSDDYAGSPLSASAHFVQQDPPASGISQCVQVSAGAGYELTSRFRFDAPLGTLAVLSQACEFFAAAGCSGSSLGDQSISSLLESGGSWNTTMSTFLAPAGAASARCSFETGPLGGASLFDLYVDGLFFGTGSSLIFSDGFESGDTSAWSATVP